MFHPTSDEPCYIISVAADMIGAHEQTLRQYERLGLVTPRRSKGNIRLYSPRDIERLRQIKSLTEDLGVNLAGVEIILKLKEEMERMRAEFEQELARVREEYEREIARLKAALQRIEGGAEPVHRFRVSGTGEIREVR
jgi:MerR family transcriptional regulator/heat shock protein HspR